MVYVIPVESSEVEHDKKVDPAKVMIVHHPPGIIQCDKAVFWKSKDCDFLTIFVSKNKVLTRSR